MADNTNANSSGSGKTPAPPGAVASAEEVLADPSVASRIVALGKQLIGERATDATRAARVLDQVIELNPAACAPIVDRLVKGLSSPNKRVAATSAAALPQIARVAPARVAKHLDTLRALYPSLPPVGKDGLVRTFTALCLASVAYQKRLESVLKLALREADPKTLTDWAAAVLPALKGEPHANARLVVERRLPDLDRAHGQRLADLLGVRLRPKR